ncbi:MAG: DNA polymerase III subunit gamma/tau [Pseudomonadota bacterium]|nr:DNA polymerase III subunit gamma/tau [Pseudomonadota bacterium]
MNQSNEDINEEKVFSPTVEDDNQNTFLGSEKSSKKNPESLRPDELKAKGGQYKVLARKYRPQKFEDLLGQETMVQILRNAFSSGRIAHAFMLTGVRGVGKTTTARLLARSLNYKSSKVDEPTIDFSESGDHCQEIMESRHIDVMEMDAASRTGIADIREILDSINYSTASARYKIYIIDEVHMLSKSAFNGLLKTLEEPPEHVKFIFATTEVHKVPLTILSRCQRFDLRQLDEELMLKLLSKVTENEGAKINEGSLKLIGRAAEGSARDGLSLLDQAITLSEGNENFDVHSVRDMLGLSDHARIIDLYNFISTGEIGKALWEIKDQIELGAEPSIIILSLGEIIHEMTRLKVTNDDKDNLFLGPENMARIKELKEKIDVKRLTRLWQMILKADQEVKNSFKPTSALEMVVIRMAYISNLPTPDEIIKSLDDEISEKKNFDTKSPPKSIEEEKDIRDDKIMSKINSDPNVRKIMEHFPETEVKSFNNREDSKNESNETE